MLLAEDFLVILEGALAEASTHEVVVADARGEAAANRGPRTLTVFAALRGGGEREVCQRCGRNATAAGQGIKCVALSKDAEGQNVTKEQNHQSAFVSDQDVIWGGHLYTHYRDKHALRTPHSFLSFPHHQNHPTHQCNQMQKAAMLMMQSC